MIAALVGQSHCLDDLQLNLLVECLLLHLLHLCNNWLAVHGQADALLDRAQEHGVLLNYLVQLLLQQFELSFAHRALLSIRDGLLYLEHRLGQIL